MKTCFTCEYFTDREGMTDSLVAPSGTFFAQRFRSRFHLAAWDQAEPAKAIEPTKASRIVIRRGADLPAATAVAIYRLELRQ